MQLEMQYTQSKDNFFKQKLDELKFYILFEIEVPDKEHLQDAQDELRSMQETLNQFENPAGFAFINTNPNSVHPVELTSVLDESNKNKSIIYLSGKNSTKEKLQDDIKICIDAGFENISFVSGDGTSEAERTPFVESVNALSLANQLECHSGAVVNPFKYTTNDIFPQYHKLIKKFNNKANFITTQFGWDMKKLQELRIYLNHRDLHSPIITRQRFLSVNDVKNITNGKVPGVHISQDFHNLLNKELQYSNSQFLASQWRRLQINTAGCKLLGFSGIQISGLKSAKDFKAAYKLINNAFTEFSKFEKWKKVYFEHIAHYEMGPYPHLFYIYNNLLSDIHITRPTINEPELDKVTLKDKLLFKACDFLFSNPKSKISNNYLLKSLLLGCKTCDVCSSNKMAFVCRKSCPKQLANGPCGGSKANGDCELSDKECIHSKIMRIALWLNRVDILEEYVID